MCIWTLCNSAILIEVIVAEIPGPNQRDHSCLTLLFNKVSFIVKTFGRKFFLILSYHLSLLAPRIRAKYMYIHTYVYMAFIYIKERTHEPFYLFSVGQNELPFVRRSIKEANDDLAGWVPCRRNFHATLKTGRFNDVVDLLRWRLWQTKEWKDIVVLSLSYNEL